MSHEPVDISTLTSSDFVTDGNEHYAVFDKPYLEDNVWCVSTTCSGDAIHIFKQGDMIWKDVPAWIKNAQERSKHQRAAKEISLTHDMVLACDQDVRAPDGRLIARGYVITNADMYCMPERMTAKLLDRCTRIRHYIDTGEIKPLDD